MTWWESTPSPHRPPYALAGANGASRSSPDQPRTADYRHDDPALDMALMASVNASDMGNPG